MIDIKSKFASTAWAYAVFYDKIQVGVWNGSGLLFHDRPFDEDDLVELRVFDSLRELRCVRLPSGELVSRFLDDSGKELTNRDVSDLHYSVYGENSSSSNGWTRMTETRGGDLWFPAELKQKFVYLKIRNYFLWSGIKAGKKGADDSGLKPGQGALSFTDYRFVGFFCDGKGSEGVKINAGL
jgi:CRISPR-associated protein (TIGR03984 family)